MNRNLTFDTCEPDFADVAAATMYSILLISLVMIAI